MSAMGERPSSHDRAFRLLLRLLPRDFRSSYARDMEATFRAERRDAAGGIALAWLWLSTLASLLRAAAVEHWDVLVRDVRFAARSAARHPGQALAAVLTLALGLGATIALFSVVDAVLLAPLPYADAGRLVAVHERANESEPGRVGYLTFTDLRARSRTLLGLAAASNVSATLAGDGKDAERVAAGRVSAGYFELLGVKPRLGRSFAASEDKPGSSRQVVMLAESLWRRRFGADPGVLGRPIEIGGTAYVVIGVLPALRDDLIAERTFGGAELYTPLGYDQSLSYACRTCRHLEVFGRLAPGVTEAQATRELDGLLAGLALEHPKEYDRPSTEVVSLREMWLGPVRPVLVALACGVLLLLASACANVSSLLLLRASERTHEIAVRTALGVGRARLVRQLATESLLLALAGGALGLGLATAALRLAASLGPLQIPRLASATLDARAIGFGLGLALACALAFGVVPLGRLVAGTAALHGGRRTGDLATWRLRSWLVAGNVAVSVALLVGSLLLAKSLLRLLATAPGFDPERVLTAELNLSGAAYRAQDEAQNVRAATGFYAAVLDRARALPGVEAAGAVSTLPLGGGVDGYGLHVVGRPLANPESAPSADRFVVTPGLLEALRVRLVRGRRIDARDVQGAAAVAVVNRRLAEEIFPGEEAIGHEIALGPPEAAPRTIVGVVESVRHHGLDQPPGYQVYVPQAQWAWAETGLTFVLRTTGDPASLAAPLRAIVRELDPAQPLDHIERYTSVVARTTGTRRFATALITGFAASALALALVGLYGALGVVVSQRRREIGVRMALGARSPQIRRMVVAQGLRPVALGLSAGLGLAAVASGVLGSLLYRVAPLDPATFAGAGAALASCAALACLGPAWRASTLDPVATLRNE
jgi:putative ABC transport system permease protein